MWFRVNSEQKDLYLSKASAQGIAVRLFDQGQTSLIHFEQGEEATAFDELSAVQPRHGYVLADRSLRDGTTEINVRGAHFSEQTFQCIAGPCAVESLAQLEAVADTLVTTGTPFLRAGAFKPRTSPYAFQGLGLEGLRLLADVARRFDLRIVSELMDIQDIDTVVEYVDVIQIGSRNMHNTTLLKAVGQLDKPILLKRGFAATYEEFLLAAEYILFHGNPNVILCERGIRAFPDQTRNVLDLAGVALLKQKTHLPVIVDPSHATGLSELVLPMAQAALATGADGVMIEMHPTPAESISDARQAISFDAYQTLVEKLKQYAAIEHKGVNTCS